MEAMPPRGNPSVVPRDHSYTDAHSDRQCEFTFQPVNSGRARTRVSAKPRQCPILVTTTVLARETRGTPDSGSRWVGTKAHPYYGISWGPASLPVHFLDSWMARNEIPRPKVGHYGNQCYVASANAKWY
jgi:hypothetical protein